MEPAPLDVKKIARGTQHLRLQPELIFLPVTDSTNRMARELPSDEWRHGTVILTDYQEWGKGRKGRGWNAPERSSLLMSVVLVPPSYVSPADVIMVASLAVADAAEALTGAHAGLKWPNDVLIDGRKVSGILAEVAESGGVRRFILGIGLNVNFDPSAAGVEDATSLSLQTGKPVDREKVAVSLLTALDRWLATLGDDPDAAFREWAGRLETIGRHVSVIESHLAWDGFAVAVERDGGLRVRTSDGQSRVVYAADVSVRPQ